MPLTPRRIASISLKIMLVILAGFAVAWALLSYAPARPVPWVPSVRWWSLVATTGVVFWVAVKRYRHYWRRPSFWLKVTGLLVIHLLAYSVVLVKVPEWRLLWFVPPSVIEGGVLVLVLNKLVSHT